MVWSVFGLVDTEEAPDVWLLAGEFDGGEEVWIKGTLLEEEVLSGESPEAEVPASEVLVVLGLLGVVEVCGVRDELVGFVLFAPVLFKVLVVVGELIAILPEARLSCTDEELEEGEALGELLLFEPAAPGVPLFLGV